VVVTSKKVLANLKIGKNQNMKTKKPHTVQSKMFCHCSVSRPLKNAATKQTTKSTRLAKNNFDPRGRMRAIRCSAKKLIYLIVSQVSNISGSHSDDLRLTIGLHNQSSCVIDTHGRAHNFRFSRRARWQYYPHAVIARPVEC